MRLAVNTDWVNFRGAWAVHLLLILVGKVTIDMAPITRTMSWTVALQLYLGVRVLLPYFPPLACCLTMFSL